MKYPAVLTRGLQATLLGAFFALPFNGLTAAPLVVAADTSLPQDSVATYDSISVSNGAKLTIGGGSDVTVSGAVSVADSSSIVFAGKNNTAPLGSEWLGVGSTLRAASVSVESGSAIHADGQGYPSNKGPGAGASNTYGGTFGGQAKNPSGNVYGSMREPASLGSSGGVYGSSVAAGGAIRLVVSGTLSVDGRLSANGVAVSGVNHSGASGGSMWITAGSLAGSGTIGADASVVGTSSGNSPSGGGRVAVYFESLAGFDLAKVSASGGEGAQDGTVYLLDSTQANGELTVNGRVRIQPDETKVYGTISIENGGQLELGGGSNLSATSIVIKSGGRIIAEAKDNSAKVGEEWVGVDVDISTGGLEVQVGGAITGLRNWHPRGGGLWCRRRPVSPVLPCGI